MWYPDKDFVAWVHEVILERSGGFSGFERGLDCFDAILTNVKTTRGLYRKTAVLLREMVTHRIFADANHRTAYELAKVFLEMNGRKTKTTDSTKIFTFIKDILNYETAEIEEWLKHGEAPKRP